MTEQATNFKNTCKGGNVNTIHHLLHLQSQPVLDELMQEFKTDSYEELAYRLAGK